VNKKKKFKSQLILLIVVLSIIFYGIWLNYVENVIKYIKCPTYKGDGTETMSFLDQYFGYTEDWFYFNWDRNKQEFKNKRFKLLRGKNGFITNSSDEEDKNVSLQYLDFNVNTSMGFVWVKYKIDGVTQPEIKYYGCYKVSQNEMPKSF
tara:strand:- start:94 stop:540 length:447 start_codon:yes stop_codon:yes gene_type:complete